MNIPEMNIPEWLSVSEEVATALAERRPIVALESTLITHGLPYPHNLETATQAESVVRQMGAIPATIAIVDGRPTVGVDQDILQRLATDRVVAKVSRRDLAAAMVQQKLGGTTVSATMMLAHQSGIRVFATGGIGGVHTDYQESLDISADLTELAQTPVLVVCAGAKSILDLPKTLEWLETAGVPVMGYQRWEFPAFYVSHSGLNCSTSVDSASQAAAIFDRHTQMGGGGCLLTQAIEERWAIPAAEFAEALKHAMQQARSEGISGARSTPYLLQQIAQRLGERALRANQALIVANARLAAEVATHLGKQG